jgi:hypothetical protein
MFSKYLDEKITSLFQGVLANLSPLHPALNEKAQPTIFINLVFGLF